MTQLTSSLVYSVFLDKKDQNWVFSPASYLEALSNVSLCVKGKNLQEIITVAPDIATAQAKGLDTYNCLLYADEYGPALNPEVVTVLKSKDSDFRSFFSLEEVVNTVNALVNEKTHGKIPFLLTSSDVDDLTKFIVLNCVYFKKKWLHPFKDKRDSEPFNGATKTSSIKYLHHKTTAGSERYYEDDHVDIAELSYKESNVCCYLIVPKNSLFEVMSDFTGLTSKIGRVSKGMDLDVTVPSFKTETTLLLKEATSLAGIKSLFKYNKDWTLFDFSLLKEEAVLAVQKIIQKAYLDFTKDGTEAAAATAFLVSGCFFGPIPPPLPVKCIRADKPFLYILANRDEPEKPLFVGVVNDVADTPGITIVHEDLLVTLYPYSKSV